MGEGKMNLYQKMLEIQNELKSIGKNASIQLAGGRVIKAVRQEDVINAIIPLEHKYGVFSYPIGKKIIESKEVVKEYKSGGQSVLNFVRVETTYRFINAEKPEEYIDIIGYGDGIDDSDKAPGKATTYSEKYSLMSGYKIKTGEDTDSNTAEGKIVKENRKKQQALDDLNAREEAYKEKMQQTMKKQSPVMDTLIDLVNEHIAVSTSILEKALAHFGVKRTIDLTDEQAQTVINAIKRDIKEKL